MLSRTYRQSPGWALHAAGAVATVMACVHSTAPAVTARAVITAFRRTRGEAVVCVWRVPDEPWRSAGTVSAVRWSSTMVAIAGGSHRAGASVDAVSRSRTSPVEGRSAGGGGVQCPGDAEVDDPGTVVGQQHVGGFEIAVHQTAGVYGGQPFGQSGTEHADGRCGQRSVAVDGRL
ncbi:hypothetical protein BJF79_07140 [Actinomadura sp. CNU-125]|nr:hypothetical protein BJF79_07140 [Actinomadura sp. CNU-125]